MKLKFLINASQELCIWSFNSRGFCSQKQDFCRYLSEPQAVGNCIPIICNQENFVLRANSYKIVNALPDLNVKIKPAVKMTSDIGGRPSNGMFVAFPKKVELEIEDISPNHWRIQAFILTANNNSYTIRANLKTTLYWLSNQHHHNSYGKKTK